MAIGDVTLSKLPSLLMQARTTDGVRIKKTVGSASTMKDPYLSLNDHDFSSKVAIYKGRFSGSSETRIIPH